MRGTGCWFVCGLLVGLLGGERLTGQQPVATPDEATQRLGAVEVVSSYQVYLLHGYIALVAQRYDEGKVDADATRGSMGELITICNVQTKALQPVRNGKISDADRRVLDQLLAITELLQKQAQAVSDLTQTSADVDREKFAAARNESWTKIKVLLGISEPITQAVNTSPPVTTTTATSPTATSPTVTRPTVTRPTVTRPTVSPTATSVNNPPPAVPAPPALLKSNPPPPSVTNLPAPSVLKPSNPPRPAKP